MILAIHLWIQHERNFDQGCWGLGESVTQGGALEGCRDPALKSASSIYGISTAALGYAFYFAIATLAFFKTILTLRFAKLCNDISDVLVGMGFICVLYLLFFQAFIAKAFCPLCLVSSAIIIALFAIKAIQWKRGGFVPVPDSAQVREVGCASGMVFGALGLLVAVLLFVDQIATRGLGQGLSARPSASAAHLKVEDWIKPETPVLGASSGVSVIGFLDPNCPHCKETYASMMRLSAQYHDKAGFYIIPRALWSYSMLQVQALELVKQNGKYFDMWRLQFEHGKKGGLRIDDLESIFRELGMDAKDLEQRLSAVLPTVTSDLNRAKAAGINSTPSIFIDGVAATNRGENALAELIEQAVANPKAKSKNPLTDGTPGG